MRSEAYLDLVKSILDVVNTNVAMVIDELEMDNAKLVDHTMKLERANSRLETENKLIKDDNNRLKGEVIKLLDKIHVGERLIKDLDIPNCADDIDDFGLHGFMEETYDVEEFTNED